jgi:hypothetical protein
VPATAVGLIIFAIAWLVTYYLTGQWFDLGANFDFLRACRTGTSPSGSGP